MINEPNYRGILFNSLELPKKLKNFPKTFPSNFPLKTFSSRTELKISYTYFQVIYPLLQARGNRSLIIFIAIEKKIKFKYNIMNRIAEQFTKCKIMPIYCSFGSFQIQAEDWRLCKPGVSPSLCVGARRIKPLKTV